MRICARIGTARAHYSAIHVLAVKERVGKSDWSLHNHFFPHDFLLRHAQQTKQKRNRVGVDVFLSKIVGAVRNWSPFD